jgi:hypothetical protein
MRSTLRRLAHRWWFSLLIVVLLVGATFLMTPVETVFSRYYSYLPLTIR